MQTIGAEKNQQMREKKETEVHKAFAKVVRTLQEETGTKSADLGTALFRSKSDVSKFLNKEGMNKIPLSVASMTADYFNVSIDYLAGRSLTKKYEYNSVVHTLGLSEDAVNILTSAESGSLSIAVSYLLVHKTGRDLLEAINSFILDRAIIKSILDTDSNQEFIDKITLLIEEFSKSNPNATFYDDAFAEFIESQSNIGNINDAEKKNTILLCRAIERIDPEEIDEFKCNRALIRFIDEIRDSNK